MLFRRDSFETPAKDDDDDPFKLLLVVADEEESPLPLFLRKCLNEKLLSSLRLTGTAAAATTASALLVEVDEGIDARRVSSVLLSPTSGGLLS